MNSIARKRLVMAHAITSSEGSEQQASPREGYPTPFRFIEYDSYSDGPAKMPAPVARGAVFQTQSRQRLKVLNVIGSVDPRNGGTTDYVFQFPRVVGAMARVHILLALTLRAQTTSASLQ